MGIFEKMNWFGSSEKKEDNRKMDELAENAKKILEDESAVKNQEIADNQEGQKKIIEEARDIVGEKGYEEINDLSQSLRGLLEEGTKEYEDAIKALMEDYGWNDTMAKQNLSIVYKSIVKLGKRKLEPPDEKALHENSPEAPSRNSRLLVHQIVEQNYGPAMAMEVDPLIDQIMGNAVKNKTD